MYQEVNIGMTAQVNPNFQRKSRISISYEVNN